MQINRNTAFKIPRRKTFLREDLSSLFLSFLPFGFPSFYIILLKHVLYIKYLKEPNVKYTAVLKRIVYDDVRAFTFYKFKFNR